MRRAVDKSASGPAVSNVEVGELEGGRNLEQAREQARLNRKKSRNVDESDSNATEKSFSNWIGSMSIGYKASATTALHLGLSARLR